MENIKRQKIVDRNDFDEQDKWDIGEKSNHHCCHCGREVYPHHGATIDHFVPLSKGGINQNINLIMLCDECNREKNNLIVSPDQYINDHLKPEHKEKLCDYFNSFVSSFEFIDRENLLACDIYYLEVFPLVKELKMSKRKKNTYLPKVKYTLKKATMDDYDKIVEYYIRYLKKYDMLANERFAKLNILFWLQFGVIYYIEKDNDIKVVSCVTIQDQPEKEEDIEVLDNDEDFDGVVNSVVIDTFCYYTTPAAFNLAAQIIEDIPSFIMKEQNLTQLPVRYEFLRKDTIGSRVLSYINVPIIHDSDASIMASNVIINKGEKMKPYQNEGLQRFFSKFKDIKKNMETWIEIHRAEDVSWMLGNVTVDTDVRKKNEYD